MNNLLRGAVLMTFFGALGVRARSDAKAFRAECKRRASFCVWAVNGSDSPAHVFQSCVLDLCAQCSYPEDFK